MGGHVTDYLNGWHDVDAVTRVRYENDVPVEAMSLRDDLDASEDDIAEFHGAPLYFYDWGPSDIFDKGNSREWWSAKIEIPEPDDPAGVLPGGHRREE